jgi:hypothetical protein
MMFNKALLLPKARCQSLLLRPPACTVDVKSATGMHGILQQPQRLVVLILNTLFSVVPQKMKLVVKLGGRTLLVNAAPVIPINAPCGRLLVVDARNVKLFGTKMQRDTLVELESHGCRLPSCSTKFIPKSKHAGK